LLCSCFYRDQSCVSTVPLSGFFHRHSESEFYALCYSNGLCQNGLHYQHRARSYSCVSFRWLNGVTQYWSRNLCGFAYYRNTSHKSGSAFGEYFCRVLCE
ncbi:hypothetical protein T06_459, partial [Trichinella sp. T6]